jgi:hypothetical protein
MPGKAAGDQLEIKLQFPPLAPTQVLFCANNPFHTKPTVMKSTIFFMINNYRINKGVTGELFLKGEDRSNLIQEQDTIKAKNAAINPFDAQQYYPHKNCNVQNIDCHLKATISMP